MQDFNQSEHSGTVGFLIGLVLLVFVGIGLSLLIDKRSNSSSGRIATEEEIHADARELERLRAEVESARTDWDKRGQHKVAASEEAVRLSAEVKANSARLADLRKAQTAAADELAVAKLSAEQYRDSYRNQVRSAAVGEKHPELMTTDGRNFVDVTIRQVFADGMEIQHSTGHARLAASDLRRSWHDRFNWNAEEMALNKPAQDPPGTAAKPTAPRSGVNAAAPASPPQLSPQDLAKVEQLRGEVEGLRSRYLSTLDEARHARGQAGSSRSKSPPGSLETWADRANRLESKAIDLRSKYTSARTKLAAAAPNEAAGYPSQP